MHLERILEHNQRFVSERSARPLPPPERLELAVVACYDPRLDQLVPAALGLASGGAFLIRTAGALVQPGSSSLRSLAMAVFMFGVKEVIVVGHSSCRMASFDASEFIDSFRRRGVTRESFGPEDLRTWAGAIPNPRQGVQQSVANILATPFLPRDVVVAGLVLDDAVGSLEVIVRPGEAPAAVAGPIEAPASASEPGEAARPEAPPAEAHAGAPKGAPREGKGGAQPEDPLVEALARFVGVVESKAEFRNELHQLRSELDRPASPLVKFGLLDGFVRRTAGASREVAEAYAELRREIGAARGQWGPHELIQSFLALARRK